jgi:hypothetical protein
MEIWKYGNRGWRQATFLLPYLEVWKQGLSAGHMPISIFPYFHVSIVERALAEGDEY